eukprot:2171158-Pleurochrysis_carterae.AAC.1
MRACIDARRTVGLGARMLLERTGGGNLSTIELSATRAHTRFFFCRPPTCVHTRTARCDMPRQCNADGCNRSLRYGFEDGKTLRCGACNDENYSMFQCVLARFTLPHQKQPPQQQQQQPPQQQQQPDLAVC